MITAVDEDEYYSFCCQRRRERKRRRICSSVVVEVWMWRLRHDECDSSLIEPTWLELGSIIREEEKVFCEPAKMKGDRSVVLL
jgi:hypothetical protein